ncbi:MAG: NAD(P)-binding protein [Syntrophorhabdus aromaticivorans]|uniref:NAD(P)-binding protein n=1 Tax=Syntrophorhabdus aromaticivorans TaxID=328301 RepID=A0A971S2L6_9BACT|nr:NAD(P)-binding protein [Syntrophorhabdus aromaticivorans]
MRIGILGGGLSGLGLQRFLKHESEVLEKQERVGGLCRTLYKDGFYYDIGGHILFSKDDRITAFTRDILGENINNCRRNNKILYKGRYVKYPFENGLGMLDKEDIFECLLGYLNNGHSDPCNFEEWILHTFGDGISEKYLIPYNRKIWKAPLKEMGMEWVERIPKPPLEDVIKSAVGIETEGYTHQLFFDYPSYGGIEALVKAIIEKDAEITTGYEVKKISRKGRGYIVSDGTTEKEYDRIVLTIPIKEAIQCIADVPENVLRAAAALRHNSVRIVLVGVNNESLLDKTAVYIPDPSVAAHRICYMGSFSRSNVPVGKSSLVAEISTYKGHEFHEMSDASLMEIVASDLDRLGVIRKNEITAADITNIEYGYIVYDLKCTANLDKVKGYLSSMGIEMLGRFGEFDYINMDEVIRRSMSMAKRLNGIE